MSARDFGVVAARVLAITLFVAGLNELLSIPGLLSINGVRIPETVILARGLDGVIPWFVALWLWTCSDRFVGYMVIDPSKAQPATMPEVRRLCLFLLGLYLAVDGLASVIQFAVPHDLGNKRVLGIADIAKASASAGHRIRRRIRPCPVQLRLEPKGDHRLELRG
jgi:hypothetical protein